MGRDRWARGDEISCGAGGCRNLATWTLKPAVEYLRPWLSCNLHLPSRLKLLRERSGYAGIAIEPFQDISNVPSRKRKAQRLGPQEADQNEGEPK